ncbi:MAG TPA: threonine--tRNA ligase [Chloroflexota bacterium]|nr:threonine--tRNA ligase [Chloroflexota bacterium]
MNDLERMRHSCAHVMAEAVVSLFPDARLAIGPPIDEGYYYDFELPRALTPDDLKTIEERMAAIVKQNAPFVESSKSSAEARQFFAERDQPYKVELIDDLNTDRVGIYQQNNFIDLCRGPHVESTGQIGPFKLLNVAGAYWRGDEHRPMLQRIYGTAFPTQAELDAHLAKLEEAARRDHRKLGRELDLFSFSEEVGPGLVLWHPKGGRMITVIEDYWRKIHEAKGYAATFTPNISRGRLFERSGHLQFFKESMYSPMDVDGQEYYVKPMSCPFHIEIYKSQIHSYRELPIRLGELANVYRYERAGVLHGLLRVRGFKQDDAHIFCRPDQVFDEVLGVVDLTLEILGAFGFSNFQIYLSTRPAKAMGAPELWDVAEGSLRRALEERHLPFEIDAGGGAFYGPKIDLKIRDALGRYWQCTTIQFDFNMPERFDLSYIAEDGKQHRPYMVHRAILGSMERFMGVLIEHFAGAFPVWIAPIQARLLPIADRHIPFCEQARQRLAQAGVRTDVDARSERVNYKIREAQLQKIPYMLVVGDKEVGADAVAVRLRSGENLGQQSLDAFAKLARDVIDSRSLQLTQ